MPKCQPSAVYAWLDHLVAGNCGIHPLDNWLDVQVLAAKFESKTFGAGKEIVEGVRQQSVANVVRGTSCAPMQTVTHQSMRSKSTWQVITGLCVTLCMKPASL